MHIMPIFLNTTSLFSRHKILIGSILFLVLYSSALIAFATPPASPFTAGETNDPSCGPTDTNCYVGDAITVDSTYYNIYSSTIGAGAELNGAGGGTDNIFFGSNAGAVTDTGTGNLFFGRESGALNTSGDSNIFMGLYAGATNDIGAFNTFIGYKAGFANTSGIRNIGIGASGNSPNAGSLSALTTGSANTALGNQSGITLETGDGNVLFGYNANVLVADDSYATAIGFSATAAASGVALGHAAIAASYEFALDPDITNWEFQGDSYVLPVNGSISTAGVLTNDGAGNLTWEAGGGGGLIGSTSSSGTETWLGEGAGDNAGWDDHTIFVGINAGEGATGAVEGTFIGYNAGSDATDAIYSIFMGSSSGDNAANASESVFLGYNSGLDATDALRSTFVGTGAGASASDAEYSVFLGNGAGDSAANAANSTFLGKYAGSGAADAANSIFIGWDSGVNDGVDNKPGTCAAIICHSILIGDITSTGGFSNSIALGFSAENTSGNQFMVGSDASSQASINQLYLGANDTNDFPLLYADLTGVGIGTSTPNYTLDVRGTMTPLLPRQMFTGTGLDDVTFSNSFFGTNNITAAVQIDSIGDPVTYFMSIPLTSSPGQCDSTCLNDATFSGTYNGSDPQPVQFVVTMNTPGSPDTFDWTEYDADTNIIDSDTGVAITGSPQLLNDGISVTFGATTGHHADSLHTETWYHVIPEAGTDTISVRAGSSEYHFVPITGSPQSFGVFTITFDLTFDATTGHTLDDRWTYTNTSQPLAGFSNNIGTCLVDPTYGFSCSSDQRLKKDIIGIGSNSLLENVLKLNPVSYHWNQEDGSSDTHIGFIAQEMERVFPQFVTTDANGYLGISYGSLTPVLVGAIKELDIKLTDISELTTDGSFVGRIRTWLADAANGITSIFSHEIRTDKLCVGQTCVTESQLQQLLQNQNNNYNNGGTTTSGGTDTSGDTTGAPETTTAGADVTGSTDGSATTGDETPTNTTGGEGTTTTGTEEQSDTSGTGSTDTSGTTGTTDGGTSGNDTQAPENP